MLDYFMDLVIVNMSEVLFFTVVAEYASGWIHDGFESLVAWNFLKSLAHWNSFLKYD